MFLSAIVAPFRTELFVLRLGSGTNRDVRAVIEPLAGADVQSPAERVPASDLHKTVGGRSGWCERKTGRSPGALADAECSLGLESFEDGRDVRTAEPAAALDRREIVAEPGLQLLDRRSEAGAIAFHQRGQ